MGVFLLILWIIGTLIGFIILRIDVLRGKFNVIVTSYTEGTSQVCVDDDDVAASVFFCFLWPLYVLGWWIIRPLILLVDYTICRPASKLDIRESIKQALKED